MSILNGVIRNNEDRTRFYGLDVNDRVQRTIGNNVQKGTVVELAPMDNNRVYVLWDGADEPCPFVAEWLDRINEHGEVINRYTKSL